MIGSLEYSGDMDARRVEVVRSITDGFSEYEFEDFRDALERADDMDDFATLAGSLGELVRDVVDPEVEVALHGIRAGSMVGETFHGWDGWLRFWRSWLEPWGGYRVAFSDWAEVDDTVIVTLDVEARGRGSGVAVRERIAQAWTVRDGRITRLGMYASRRRAIAALGRD